MAHEYDVVVVGSGIAGLSTAISALEGGARVAVVERATEAESGGNTRYTEAFLRMASLEKVVMETTSLGSSRSTRVCAAFLAFSIGVPCIDPLTSRTRCTERGDRPGLSDAERIATRKLRNPPAGGTLARSVSTRNERALSWGGSIAGA